MLIPIPETAEHVRMMQDIASVALEKLSAAIECNMAWRVKDVLEIHPYIINRIDSYGYTSLNKAAFYNNPTICKMLLDYKADPNIGNQINITPLHVTKDHTVMDLLLGAGADIQICRRWSAIIQGQMEKELTPVLKNDLEWKPMILKIGAGVGIRF